MCATPAASRGLAPEVAGRLAVELQHKGQQFRGDFAQLLQHGLAAHVVKGALRVQLEDDAVLVEVQDARDEQRHGVRAGPRAEAKLVRRARGLQAGPELLGEGARHAPAQHISRDGTANLPTRDRLPEERSHVAEREARPGTLGHCAP